MVSAKEISMTRLQRIRIQKKYARPASPFKWLVALVVFALILTVTFVNAYGK